LTIGDLKSPVNRFTTLGNRSVAVAGLIVFKNNDDNDDDLEDKEEAVLLTRLEAI